MSNEVIDEIKEVVSTNIVNPKGMLRNPNLSNCT